MTDTGYWGDVELDERRCDDANSRRGNADFILPHNQQFFAELPRRRSKRQVPRFVSEQFFGEMPRRRPKRDFSQFVDASSVSSSADGGEPAAVAQQRSMSQYYSARWLHQYFVNQNNNTLTENSIQKIVSRDEELKRVDGNTPTMGNQVIPLVTSCHHILVEDAISFSPIPR